MTDRFIQRLLSHVADRRYKPTKIQELAMDLGVSEAELRDFGRSVGRMIEDGQLVLGASDTVMLPPPGREITGAFRLNERGFGFLTPDSPMGHGDLFIPHGSTGGALTGDRVRARVIHEPRRAGAGSGKSPYTGRIVEIIQRSERRYVGNLRKIGSQWVADIDGRMLREPVVIRDPHVKFPAGAHAGDKVVIELVEHPREDKPAIGVITEVLGEQGEPDVETLATMRAFNLSDRFPEDVLDNARDVAQTFDESSIPADRLDLTGQLVLTIDPPDAKDYDDAISIRRLDDSSAGSSMSRPAQAHPGAVWELGVHIAHVSHFVRLDSPLDRQACKRANSTYLPRKVVPMLPEMLSNGVCSLQEGVNRFCLSAFIQYDAQGRVLSQRFARSVIRSAKRLTYREAQALIDGDMREAIKHARANPKYSRPLLEALRQMNELSQIIRHRRLRDGMIVLGLPEVELIFDETGRVVDAEPEDNAYTHTLIEMFMVEANEAAARLFDSYQVPMIRRIHADPPAHDINELRQFARVAGLNIPARPTRKELQQLLDSVRGKPAQHAVHLAVLQTLSKAEYSPLLIGHFALASEHYTHFTSPIRRYPDLIVHRGLDAYLDVLASSPGQTPSRTEIGRLLRQDSRLLSQEQLVELGRHCSANERNSEAAEHDLRTYLVLDLLRTRLGDDFEGTVTGVTGEGVFIQLDRYLVDGFVRCDDLPGQMSDRWRFNRNTGALVAERSGLSITIGNRFMVRVAKVNPVRRSMELVIVSKQGQVPKPRKRTQPPGARKAHQQAMRLKRDRRQQKHKRRR